MFDVIVAGLGAMGSATAAHLSRRGLSVLGIDRWMPGHKFGSSHGDSRIIREMYFEHPMYVPLLRRAYELWDELGTLHITGGLMIGRKDGMLVEGTLRSAREHNLAYEILSHDEVARRFPPFELEDDLVAVLDPRAGWLDPEECNAEHLKIAAANGADLRFEEPLVSWRASSDMVTVTTSHGTYTAGHLVLCVGARTRKFLEVPLEVERQVVFWFEPQPVPAIWAYEYKAGHICYGFPPLANGAKASVMHSGEVVEDADTVNREIHDDEVEPLRRAIKPVLPSLSTASVKKAEVCLFTNTPDHDFIIDFHPESSRVLVSSPCSGHGFKFASVIGEVQADLVTKGKCEFDLAPFRIARFK